MGKKLLSMLLVLCMVLPLLPVVAGAVGSETPNQETDKISVTINDTTTYYNNHADGWKAAAEAGSAATVTLLADWTAAANGASTSFGAGTGFESGALLVPSGTKITLDLNGKNINRALTQGVANGNVITVHGALTIKDSSSPDVTSQGTITGGYNNTDGTYSGGGILMMAGCNLTIEGGNIAGNKSFGWGGGVKNESGTFKMTGGKISGNIANYGGGYSSSFNSSGGGVYVGGNFTMTGGEISGNSVCGSGDYRKGGGVFFFGTVTVGGTAVIQNNKSGCTYSVPDGTSVGIVSGGITDNVYLRSNKTLACSSDTQLASGAYIGVTTQTAPAVGSQVPITVGTGVGQAEYFHSDNSNYTVVSTGTGHQLSVIPQAAPTATVQAITGTLQVGETLTGHYTYNDVDGDSEGTSTYKWYRSDDAEGLGKAEIEGATAITYILQSVDSGKYISFEVTPVAVTGISTGAPVESARVGAIMPTVPDAPVIDTVTGGDRQVTVSFTAPSNTGGAVITGYTVTSSPGGITATGAGSPITVQGLTNGTTYTFTVTATNSAGTGAASEASNVVTPRFKETTPTATFIATGPDTGTLFGVENGMKYQIDSGSWTDISSDTNISLTGLSACTISVVKKGDGITTTDSAAQIITVTKAATPSLTPTQPNTIGGDGSIPMTAVHEYSTNNGSSWTAAEGTTTLEAGVYLVRIKASGTTLASDNQTITLTAFTGTPETTPTATFLATGPDTGTLSGVENGMKYQIDSGSWIDISSDTNISLTGLSACTISVVKKGNGITTTDSVAQVITVTKAATPTTAGKTDCTNVLNNDGKLTGITAAMEYKFSTASEWTNGTGSDITGLPSGTYYVRVKASGTVLASDNLSLTIASYTAPTFSGGGGTVTTTEPITKIDNGGSTTGSNLDKLISDGKTLTVEADTGAKLVFETEALKGIGAQTSDEIKVEIKEVSISHQETLPGKQVFTLTVYSGNSIISNFGGLVTVSLPYKLKEGESADKVTVWHLADNGTMTEIPCTYDPNTELATFTTTHFSLYVVGVEMPWVNPFADVKESDWFYSSVEFVNRNGLMQGVDGNEFGPNATVTRAMLVTILWRLENAPAATQKVAFSDVSDGTWYSESVFWAASKGIVTGYDGKFNPNGTLTREQMAAILYRYAAYKNYDISAADSLTAYSDIPSEWALSSVKWAVAVGLIKGSGGRLNPMGGATRAESATILQRFIENTAK